VQRLDLAGDRGKLDDAVGGAHPLAPASISRLIASTVPGPSSSSSA
jgi:hypothetical protein